MLRKRVYYRLMCLFLLVYLGQGEVYAQETNGSESGIPTEATTFTTSADPSKSELIPSSEATTILPSQAPDFSEVEAIPEGIIDSDNQILVTNTLLTPYRQVVRLESFFASGVLYGTGVMIGPDLVLTAAHNVYNIKQGQWTEDVLVIPAQNGEAEPYGKYQAGRIFMLKSYQNEETGTSESFDMAVIKLTQPVDSQVGFLPVSTEISDGNRIQVAGYPYPKTSDWKIGFMYTMWGEATSIKDNLIRYEIDTESGQSGSPVLNQDNEIVGIHTLGFVDGNQVYIYNAARRIMQDSLDMIAIAKGEKQGSEEVISHWLVQKSVHRLYHAGIQRHLYTQDQNEIAILKTRGWKYEGETFRSADYGIPVYRLYSPVTKEHLYTTSSLERDILVQRGWDYESVAWYSEGETPIYRLYHTGLKVHLYTSDTNERNVLKRRSWLDEGLAWYAQ